MVAERLKLLVLGAHPDDAEFHAGGLILKYASAGHHVKIVSVTDGSAGHHQKVPQQLVHARRAEADAVARRLGVSYDIWEFPDGRLLPTLEVRSRVLREIRQFQPDLVLTHRPCDYHPDHRAVGLAVQDASYMVTVPLIEPDVRPLQRDPVVAYMVDLFTRPYAFCGDVVFDVTAEFEGIIDLLDCHVSQVYEWLPYNRGVLDQVPADPAGRKQQLRDWFGERLRTIADRFREELLQTYGEPQGRQIQCVEAYEVSQYAAPLDPAARTRLFPFVP